MCRKPESSKRKARDGQSSAKEERKDEICDKGHKGFKEESETRNTCCVVPELIFFTTGIGGGMSTEVSTHIDFSCIRCIPD